MVNIQKIICKSQISPDLKKDQHFLVDSKIVEKMVAIARITKKDVVLEVGTGFGILTKKLAQHAKEVISIEIDERFKPFLRELPGNVKVIYGNAYKLLNSKDFTKNIRNITKTVSNIPFSQAQNMLHNYTNSSWYSGDIVWLAPASLARKVNNDPILGAYFDAKVKQVVPKSAFYPSPNTVCAIIFFKRIPDPNKTKNFEIYFRRWLYEHEDWKVKNALRESIIATAYNIKNVKVSQKKAKEVISKFGFSEKQLNEKTNNLDLSYYFEFPKVLNEWLSEFQKDTYAI